MKRAFNLCVFLLLVFLLSSCSNDNPVDSNKKVFNYTGFNKDGKMIVSGYLQFEIIDSLNIVGSWNFTQIGYTENIGPQVGQGELMGNFIDGDLHIELNPHWVDNNVSLKGSYYGSTYKGQWVYSSFVGLTNSGTFFAVK